MGALGNVLDFFSKRNRSGGAQEFWKMFTGYTPVFTSAPEGIYEAALVRSAIDSFASLCSKLVPIVRGAALERLERQWQIRINPFMTTSQFLYRVATILSVDNNAIIIPLENEAGFITGFYPLLPQNCEITEVNGTLYLRYTFVNGQRAAIEYDRVGVLTQHQYQNNFFGESNHPLKPILTAIHTNNQGVIDSVKSSAKIRFIGKTSNIFNDDDLKKERDKFSEINLSEENKSGLLLYDSRITDLTQVKSHATTVDAAQAKHIAENVYNYFGTNEGILQNKFDEEGFNAYYEGKIEPFAIQLSLVLTGMVFSNRALAHDNQIILSTNRLNYVSNKTKVMLGNTGFDRGQITVNEIREMWGKPKLNEEWADEHYIRKEYINIKDLGKELPQSDPSNE